MIGDFFKHLADFLGELLSREEIWIAIFLLVLFLGGVVFLPTVGIETGVWNYIVSFLNFIWPFFLFLVVFIATRSLWLFWRQELYKKSTKFTLLELKIPHKVERDPMAMEQVFAAIHSLRNVAGDIRQKYWDGEVTMWFSFELVSFGGEIRFYVRTKNTRSHLVESAFYSNYPDMEIVEVEDYSKKMPQNLNELYEGGYNLWGTEMVLAREEVFPIRSYKDFKDPHKDERTIDPISNFLEILAKVKKSEIVGIQILAAPADKNWRDKRKKFIEKMSEPKTKSISKENDDDEDRKVTVSRTPGEIEVLEAVERNLSKPAFDTLIRFMYISPREIFYDGFARRGLTGSFNQYAAINLNSFRQNYPMSTRTRLWNWPHILPNKRNEYRKQRILYNYINREVPPETFMGRLITSKFFNWNFSSRRFLLNTESLATLYHIPTEGVLTSPRVDVLRSRKTGVPSGLGIYSDEEDEDIESLLAKKFENEEN